MESIIQQAGDIHARSDTIGRAKLQKDMYRLHESLYSDMEYMIHLVANGPVKYAMAKIGVDLRVFEALKESDEPLTASQLAERSTAAPELLKRILRAQAALHLIDQIDAEAFQPNWVTEVLAKPDLTSLLRFQQPVFGPAYQALPEFLHARGYQNIVTEDDTAFQMAFNTDLTFAEFLKGHPEHLENLHKSMQQSYGKQWTDKFPVEREVGQFGQGESEQALLVDIGGARGQQASAFKQIFPGLPGRVIVQDRAEVIARATAIDGLQFMVHDFFETQPIKEAKFYYLRFVLHDWPDDLCVKILRAIVPAMGPESRIILDEMIPPAVGMSFWAAVMDTAMLATCGGSERSVEDWVALLDRAGLRMLELLEYDPQNLSVIVAVPKRATEEV